MKLKYSIITILFFAGLLTSCKDYLDVPPMNIIQDQDLMSSENGMLIYMARLYSEMPFEDFKYSPQRWFYDDYQVAPGTVEGSSLGRNGAQAMTSEGWVRNSNPWWPIAYRTIRDATNLLENLPTYKGSFNESRYNHFMGEAYFTRAMVYYALAKRWGGVPLVREVLKYPENSVEALETPRSSEEETWEQVLSDFDAAIANLEETSPVRGYSNKYVALAFKSEAMLYAGCISKYNTALNLTGFGEKTGVRVIGFDPSTAQAASKKYFTEAFNAAMRIIKSNKYSLYRNKWAAGDKEAQYQNMIEMFVDINSSENIYIKEYSYPDMPHGYDIYNMASQWATGANGAFNSPTLDLVELYDGIDRNLDGTIKVFDREKDDPNRKYLMFDNLMDIFKNVEPRCRAFVMLPGDTYQNEMIELWHGTYTGDVADGISPLMSFNGEVDYSLATRGKYNTTDAYRGAGEYTQKVLYIDASRSTHEIVTLPDGSSVNASGRCGPYWNDQYGSITGFSLRKAISPNKSKAELASGVEAYDSHHCVLMRYGEVLLNVAEAASELMLAGESRVDGNDLLETAYSAIHDIRERAGADPLAGQADLKGETGRDLIRKERRKELPFENKILWDIRRWRTQHSDNLNGSTQSDGAYYRGLYPFYSTRANKYFFDARFDFFTHRYTLKLNQYYFAIPSGEVSKSPVIDQQPGL
ncbi:MAG: RagB/SusD family nutrient uptake outer membrane protein [Tannerellaceae bacterium]|nr:RagB/SusD family nutrient uptake outer membrane protein [Tannerellaceae bacterium]